MKINGDSGSFGWEGKCPICERFLSDDLTEIKQLETCQYCNSDFVIYLKLETRLLGEMTI